MMISEGIGREELLRQLGVISPAPAAGPKIDPFTERAYQQIEEKDWRRNWYRTSFTGGKFPGGRTELRCPRLAMYRLMSVPEQKPIEPKGVAIMRQGMMAEEQIVNRWGRLGITIGGSVPVREDTSHFRRFGKQLKLVDKEHWLACSLDSTLDIRPEWDSVLPVDVKSKAEWAIEAMEKGQKSYDPDHYAQIQIYTRECRRVHVEMGWEAMGLSPAEGGTIYYVSRDNPRRAVEFYVPYDEDFVDAGLERLSEWKQLFESGELPERDKSWRWTEPPCKWCEVKKLCKQDVKADVDRVADSHAIEFAREIREGYDPEAAREAVFERWEGEL